MALLQSCKSFTEFTIDDVSKEHFFIDSLSATQNIHHENVSIIISGEIDSSATLVYASYPDSLGGNTFHLEKGLINIDVRADYYMGDSLWIKFTPKGAKKGHLKIKTRIN